MSYSACCAMCCFESVAIQKIACDSAHRFPAVRLAIFCSSSSSVLSFSNLFTMADSFEQAGAFPPLSQWILESYALRYGVGQLFQHLRCVLRVVLCICV